MVRINDLFWTFQGEGHFSGRRALFVRMPFCNLNCSWCDTSFNNWKKITKEDFAKVAQEEKSRFAVLTGGEPSINKDSPKVIEWLKEMDFFIAIETNGTFKVPSGIDFVTLSPKSDADFYVHPETVPRVSELKLVVDRYFDPEVAKRLYNELIMYSPYFTLSPEFNELETNFKTIEEFIKENPQWKYSLQTHKWLKIK